MDAEFLTEARRWIERFFPLLIFLGIYLYKQARQYAKARRLHQIAPLLNGRVVIRPFSAPRIEGSYTGIPYRIYFFPPGRASRGRMQIQIDYPGFFGLTLSRRDKGSGMEEIFSRGKTLTTDDEAFNQAIVARADREHEKVMLFLESPTNRKRILAIFEAGFVSVRITEKGIVLVKPGDYLTGQAFTPDMAILGLSLACRLLQ